MTEKFKEDRIDTKEKKSPSNGMRRDENAECYLTNDHDWVCDNNVCANCWSPPCQENAEILEENYKETQKGETKEEIAAKGKQEVDDKIAKRAGDIEGLEFEKTVIDQILHSQHKLEKVGYKAHCRKCHLRGDIDIVTDKYVIEVKKNYNAFKLGQMKKMIIPIAEKCFPGKEVRCITNTNELGKLQTDKLDEWNLSENLDLKILQL